MDDANAFDVVVIGGGTAGMTVARLVAGAGRRVALIEAERTGGDCLLTGCVPSKSLLAAARVAQTIRGAAAFGITVGQPVVDVAAVVARKDRIVERIGEADSPETLARAGVTVIAGLARFTSPHAIAVGDRAIRAEQVVIATGSRPAVPPIEGLADAGYVTNVEALELRAAPQRLAVIGAGPTGLELGQAFARFGSAVTVIERGERILSEHDAEAAAMAQQSLAQEGITFRLAHEAVRVERGPASKRLTSRGIDGQEIALDADEILVAT
ncbi:MAG: FAD-dependent oxidoreductase, partial [Thermomicrobiales bacterium]